MKVLVTGGTGFLGEHVVRELVAEGTCDVRTMARSSSPVLDELGVEQVRGSIEDGDALAEAISGCERVFHLAGMVSREADDSQRMMRVHVDGTRKLLRLAARAGVARVVVASSSGTCAVSKDERIHDESSGYATEVVAGWPYYASKIYQEKIALELADELDLDVVIVNPSLLLGPGDRRLSSTKDVLRFLRRQVPVIPEGGVNFVDVRDAARATVRAMEVGKRGERYLMGGPNWTFQEFFGRLSRASKVDGPRLKARGRIATFGASLIEHAYRARGSEPPVDRISVEMAQHFWWIDSRKAQRELGFEVRDPSLTLSDTVRYLRRNIATDL